MGILRIETDEGVKEIEFPPSPPLIEEENETKPPKKGKANRQSIEEDGKQSDSDGGSL